MQQFSLQTTTVPDGQNEPAVDSAENTTEGLHATAADATTSAAVITETQLVVSVQSALDRSESLKDIPECLAEALGFAKGVADLAKTFADVRFPEFLCWFHSH